MKILKNFLFILLFLVSPNIFGQTTISTFETELPLKFNTGQSSPYGMPSTIIQIQGKSLPVIFDTGSSKTEVALSSKALKGLHVRFTGKKICFNSYYGKFCEKEFIIPQIKIGSFVVNNATGLLMQKLRGLGNKNLHVTHALQNGIIGINLLSKFNLLLDYPHSKAFLIKFGNKPTGYNLNHWVSFPMETPLHTKLQLNGKKVLLLWDTGCVPSIISQTFAKDFTKSICLTNPKINEQSACLKTQTFTTLTGSKIPQTWFLIKKIPSSMKFDGQIGSNFYLKNLVYFDFEARKIYVKSLT